MTATTTQLARQIDNLSRVIESPAAGGLQRAAAAAARAQLARQLVQADPRQRAVWAPLFA